MKFGGGFGHNWIFRAVQDLINAAVTGTFKHNTWRYPVGSSSEQTVRPHEQAQPVLVQVGPEGWGRRHRLARP